MCQPIKYIQGSPEVLLTELFKGLSVYFNYSTTAKCMNYKSAMPDSLDDRGWDLQVIHKLTPFSDYKFSWLKVFQNDFNFIY